MGQVVLVFAFELNAYFNYSITSSFLRWIQISYTKQQQSIIENGSTKQGKVVLTAKMFATLHLPDGKYDNQIIQTARILQKNPIFSRLHHQSSAGLLPCPPALLQICFLVFCLRLFSSFLVDCGLKRTHSLLLAWSVHHLFTLCTMCCWPVFFPPNREQTLMTFFHQSLSSGSQRWATGKVYLLFYYETESCMKGIYLLK